MHKSLREDVIYLLSCAVLCYVPAYSEKSNTLLKKMDLWE